MNLRSAFFVAFISLLVAHRSASQTPFQTQNAFPNLTFTRPVDLQSPRDGTDRIFVVEQAGIIRVFENNANTTISRVFLDISARVDDSFNEEGLLGLAFHPDYKNNGYFYLNYTAAPPARTVIARYRVSPTDPNQADANSELVLLTYNQPFENHNGGQVAFGPDGHLYIASGDGGSGGDPQGNGQSLRKLLGKILRIDVNNPSAGRNYGIPSDNPFVGNPTVAREEIYAYGLRNPWRISFDPVTGRLWAGDVGQNTREEIDIIENGKNYGWKIMEGSLCFSPSTGCTMTGLVKPIWEYGRSLGVSVTGGYVYRGTKVPELAGAYIYGDFGSGRIWALRYDGVNPPANPDELLDTNLPIASFGVDQNNELYICAFDFANPTNGKIYRFKPTTSSIGGEDEIPTANRLTQNYPNPFFKNNAASTAGYAATQISYSLTQDNTVELNLYNMQGQLVRQLVGQNQTAGTHTVFWDGRDTAGQILPSGTYFYRLRAGNLVVETKRLHLVK